MSEQNTAVITENHLKPAWLFYVCYGEHAFIVENVQCYCQLIRNYHYM